MEKLITAYPTEQGVAFASRSTNCDRPLLDLSFYLAPRLCLPACLPICFLAKPACWGVDVGWLCFRTFYLSDDVS